MNDDEQLKIMVGDCIDQMRLLGDSTAQMIVTSPPYWNLRDYGRNGQIGAEPTVDEYVSKMVAVFREAHRVLSDDGTLWLNLGDTYQRGKKNLAGAPWRVALALQENGWILRSDIIWHKPNPMPESVTDRPTKSHEYLFLMAKSDRYYFDAEAIMEDAISTRDGHRFGGDKYNSGDKSKTDFRGSIYKSDGKRNKRDVWSVPAQPYPGAHFAVFPEALVEPCILAGSRAGDVVLDPFGGSGTTGVVANRLSRKAVLIELNADYAAQIKERCRQAVLCI